MSRHFEDFGLGSLELFCLTGDLQSFTAAAASAGLTPAAVSRTVARLEARLGTQLFVRTTRSVRLTESGRLYHEHCKQALAQLVAAERVLNGEQLAPTGVVRVSVPTGYGHVRVLPLLADFRGKHPGIELEVHLSNRNVDFAAEAFDLSIRGRTPPDSGLVARKLEDAGLVVVASPRYLRRRGTPRSVDELAAHECIHFALPSTGQLVPWVFRREGLDVEHAFRGAIRCFDDILAPVTLARAGAGLAQTYRYIVEDDLASGALKEVLQGCAGASRPFSLLYPANRHMPQRVRLLIDFLVQKLAAAPARRPVIRP